MSYTHESGCGRCIDFAVDHNGGVFGWAKVLLLFVWHRWSGACRRTASRTRDAQPKDIVEVAGFGGFAYAVCSRCRYERTHCRCAQP